MIDRWGNPVRVGFSPHEIVWIRAALTLSGEERVKAYRDISEMTGRSYANIRDKGADLRSRDRLANAWAGRWENRRVLVAAIAKPLSDLPVASGGFLRELTKERLMGRR